VLPDPVIDRQVTGQPGVLLLGILERHRIGPFLAEGLDEPLGLAVGARRVGPDADVLELEDAASLGKALGDVGRAVIAHHLTALDALAVEPGQGPAQEADRSGLLLISENLHIGEPRGDVDGHVDPVVTDACRTPLLTFAGDAVPHLAEAGQLFDVDVDQVSWRRALVALHWSFGLQIPQPPQAQAVQGPGHGGEGCREQPGDVTQVQPLMTQLHGTLQVLRIKRPPLGAANTASIRQRGWTT